MLQTASVSEVIGDVKTLGASKKWCSGVTCWFAGVVNFLGVVGGLGLHT